MEAKRILGLLSFMFFVCAVFLPGIVCGDAYHDAIINGRLKACVAKWLTNPGYNPNDPDPNYWIPGKVGYAQAALYCDVNTTLANTYINSFCTYGGGIPRTGLDLDHLWPTYFYMASIWRLHLNPDMNSLLTTAARSNIRNQMFNLILNRSKISDATSSVWWLSNSENHDALEKSCYFLACQALDDTNSTTVLGDGYTIDQHYHAWNKYFFEYFRQRAREGLNCEIASIGYNSMTLSPWYNICDLAKDPNLRKIAKDCITLFWADYANDFSPATGLRGASGTRWYKTGLAVSPPIDSVQDISYAYGLQSSTIYTVDTHELNMCVSPYRLPDIVRLAAGTEIRTPYLCTTRRFGKGTQSGNVLYHITFDANNSSHIRRNTWWQKDYVISDLELRTDSDMYCWLNSQNRAVGIFFTGNLSDRIIVDGNGYQQGKGTGYAEVTGVCGKNCLVAARDKNATYNTGVNIYIPNGPLLTNLRYDANTGWSGGWNFTQTGPYGAVGRKFVGSADANDPTWNNELMLGDKNAAPPVHTPTLTTGNSGYGGGSGNEALRFVKRSAADGNMAFATRQWQPDFNSVSIDLWFKSDRNTDTTDQILANVPMVWQVYLNGNYVKLISYTGMSYHTLSVLGVRVNGWQHLIASVNKNGYQQLKVDSNSAAPYSFTPMTKVTGPTDIVLGNKPGYTRWYSGLIDKVRITCPNMPGSPQIAAWNMDSSYNKDVYVAFKIANGGYKEGVEPFEGDGHNLTLKDMHSPVVFEVNSAANYASYNAFKAAVKGSTTRRWWYDANTAQRHLTYKSMAGTTYEYWGYSGNLPKIGTGTTATINLNPNKTYDCNTLQGYHGRDDMTISYPNQQALNLNFNYTTSPMWDDYQTIALWHMDNINFVPYVWWVNDSNTEHPGRNNYLRLFGTAVPTLVSGPISNFGMALSFNDPNKEYGQAGTNWASYNTVKVDLWFKAGTTSGNHTLVDANNVWEIRQEGSNLKFYVVWAPPYYANSATINCITDTTTWHHVTATCDAAGNMKLTVDGTTVNGSGGLYPCPMQSLNTGIYVGQLHNSYYFNGCLDDIKISKYSIP